MPGVPYYEQAGGWFRIWRLSPCVLDVGFATLLLVVGTA